ncbi:Peptidase_M15_like domain containing protein [Candidatus Nanopelagicaceae bacterium]
MQWVAKKEIAIAVIFLPLLVGILTAFFADEIAPDSSLPPTLTCFESSTATLRVTTADQCIAPLISLGNSPLSDSATASGNVVALNPILQARFGAAQVAAELEGVHLYITSGFRDESRQAVLFANAIKKYGSESEAAKWVLPPQFSHHPHGLAIDVNYPGDRPGAEWLESNGSRFGLCRVYANEWWHFEGVIAPGESCPEMAANALVDMR